MEIDLVTLQDWVYPTGVPYGVPIYAPRDGVNRHNKAFYNSPTPAQPGVYRPNGLVESFDSLVWVEGFRTSGSFELKTFDIKNTLAKLPKGTLVSLRDSEEVCIVTTHHIGTNEKNQDVLTVKGISVLTYILSNRPTWAYQPNGTNTENAKHANIVFQVPDHLVFLLWGCIVFPFSEGGFVGANKKPFELPENIIVPHTEITQNITIKGDYWQTEWPPPIETRLASVNAVLELDPRFGIRTVRPTDKTSLKIYSPTLTSLHGEGTYTTRSDLGIPSKLSFNVFQVNDLTTGADDKRVIFRYDSGDVVRSEYISSIENHKNMVSAHSEIDPTEIAGAPAVGFDPPNIQYAGFDPPVYSRLVWPDDGKYDSNGNSLSPPLDPNQDNRKYIAGLKFHMGEVTATTSLKDTKWDKRGLVRLVADGLKAIKDNAGLDIMTAEISPYTQFKYGRDYTVGDIVLVQGKYGAAQKMQVSEYTRTADSNGITGYPTLTRWEAPS